MKSIEKKSKTENKLEQKYKILVHQLRTPTRIMKLANVEFIGSTQKKHCWQPKEKVVLNWSALFWCECEQLHVQDMQIWRSPINVYCLSFSWKNPMQFWYNTPIWTPRVSASKVEQSFTQLTPEWISLLDCQRSKIALSSRPTKKMQQLSRQCMEDFITLQFDIRQSHRKSFCLGKGSLY